jgi:hypothetical protein
MHWTGWIVIVLVIFNAGWMLFDGTRALIAGDYVTPSTGDRAGRLGPWARVVSAVGLNPRSTPVKLVFVVYGAAALILAACFALRLAWAWWGLLAAAALGLWYLPVGTAINVAVLVLLLLHPGR